VSAPSTIIIDVVLLFVLFEVDTRRTWLAGGAATLLSSHAGHPRPATSDTTKESQANRPTASKRVSPPPVGTISSASDVTDHRTETASLKAAVVLRVLPGRARWM
jgi:hypothetical protein